MLLLSEGNIHTTSVRGLLHEIIPTIPDATTWKQTPHTSENPSAVIFLINTVCFQLDLHLQRSQPRMDRIASLGLRRWRPCWWKRRPGPWPPGLGGTALGTGVAVLHQAPGPTCPCGCRTSLETPRPKPRCWSLMAKACQAVCGGGWFHTYSGFIKQIWAAWKEVQASRWGRDINAGFRTPLCHNYAPSSPLAGAISSAQCPIVRTIVQWVSPRTLSAESWELSSHYTLTATVLTSFDVSAMILRYSIQCLSHPMHFTCHYHLYSTVCTILRLKYNHTDGPSFLQL